MLMLVIISGVVNYPPRGYRRELPRAIACEVIGARLRLPESADRGQYAERANVCGRKVAGWYWSGADIVCVNAAMSECECDRRVVPGIASCWACRATGKAGEERRADAMSTERQVEDAEVQRHIRIRSPRPRSGEEVLGNLTGVAGATRVMLRRRRVVVRGGGLAGSGVLGRGWESPAIGEASERKVARLTGKADRSRRARQVMPGATAPPWMRFKRERKTGPGTQVFNSAT